MDRKQEMPKEKGKAHQQIKRMQKMSGGRSERQKKCSAHAQRPEKSKRRQKDKDHNKKLVQAARASGLAK